MGKLVFQAAAVRRVVEHALANPQAAIADYSTANAKNGWKCESKVPAEPNVILVHDDGVYLMSNGTPRDVVKKPCPNGKGETDSAFCAYARGCDPVADKETCWDAARGLVGGDDFGEYFPWAAAIKQMLDDGATSIVVGFGKSKCSLSAVYPKGKGPMLAPVPESADDLAKRLQKMMRKQVVGLNTKEGKIVIFKVPATPVVLAAIATKRPEVKVLNGKPTLELFQAIAVHQGAR